jgi:Polyketide cyclase / dehydrase and lipid transport
MSSSSRVALLVASALCLSGALPSGESMLSREPPELVKRLYDNGLVVMEDVAGPDRTSFVVAYVMFAQPRERALALVTDPRRQTEWRSDLKRVDTVETGTDTRVDEIRMKVMFRELVYRVRYRREPETDRIAWTLDSRFDNDLSRFEGFWEFYPLQAGGTLGRFGTHVDAGAAIPAFMQKDLTRRSVVTTMENCRKWVDSDGAWRP